ncbi:MAG: LTA synthase family protein, partial [Betaproteobacteria bacterium]
MKFDAFAARGHPQPSRSGLLPPIILVCVAAALAAARAMFVRGVFENSGNCESCLFWQTFASDLAVVGSVGVLGAVQLIARSLLVKRTMMVLQLIIVLVMTVDVMLFKMLSVRLYLADIEKFGVEFGAIVNFIRLSFGATAIWISAAAAVLIGGVVWLAFRSRQSHPRAAAVVGGVALCAFVASAAGTFSQSQFVVEEWVRNWFVMNLDQGVSRPYSRKFEEASKQSAVAVPAPVCVDGDASRKNVVVVVVESLAAYHSALLGGRGWTPELDRIASHSHWHTNFHANGFTTDMGLISLFTAKPPLPSVGRYGGSHAYDGYWTPAGSLPAVAAANGYESAFLTTGDLHFLDKGDWAKSIGFNHVEGDDNPFYDGMPRFHFHAAPDAALFDRFMQWRAQHDASRPYVAALLTVSSHPPFLSPDGPRGEEAAIRYADRQLGQFYQLLTDAHFFDNGMLVILGDHRAMTQVTAEERAKYGDRALSRIPLIVAADPMAQPVRVDLLGQQADLVHSLAVLTGKQACASPDHGDFLSSRPKAADPVIHVRGDRRSWLSVYSPDGHDASIRMDGDDTAWVG